uniref:Pentatricopeptide repeat-containing protein At1g71490 family n=1 Tax=Cajanus cajan TaxID=3821 RepID=A0A151SD22_CAJCA|nr:Pentatricopeptide repeat-containing protein At1g71490 family [Cajanus cajan]
MVGLLIASLKDFVTHGHLSNAFKTFSQIQHHAPSSHLLLHPISSLLFACANHTSLSQGKQLHAHILSLGLHQNHILVPKLITFYTNVNLLTDAQFVAESSNSFDPLHWNMVISLYVKNGFFAEALSVYKKMLSRKIEPDEYTYPSVLKACGESLDLDTGVEVHKSIEGRCMEWSLFVHNALVSMYGRFGKLEVARHLFDKMPTRDAVSWNTIISCYASRGALKLISQMRSSIHLDAVAMVVGLNACSHIGALKLGKEIHGHAVRTCFDVFDNVRNALITMYSRCRDLGHAFMLFHKMEEKGLITWNAMLSGYAHMDRSEEVTFLFREMLQKGMEPNYDYLLLWNALVDMYARSGKVLEARKVFDSLSTRDEVTYTSMITGYGMKGDGETALKLFEEMCKLEIKPDHVTMVAVLTACSHSGLALAATSGRRRPLCRRLLPTVVAPPTAAFGCYIQPHPSVGVLLVAAPPTATFGRHSVAIGRCRRSPRWQPPPLVVALPTVASGCCLQLSPPTATSGHHAVDDRCFLTRF